MTEQELIDRLEKATGPDRELDGDIHAAVYGGVPSQRAPYAWMRSYGPAFVFQDKENGTATDKDAHALQYTASIDAALSLVPEGYSPVIALTGVWAEHMPNAGQPIWQAAFPDRGTEDFEEYTIGEIGDFEASGKGPTPAIALCIAALKARVHLRDASEQKAVSPEGADGPSPERDMEAVR